MKINIRNILGEDKIEEVVAVEEVVVEEESTAAEEVVAEEEQETVEEPKTEGVEETETEETEESEPETEEEETHEEPETSEEKDIATEPNFWSKYGSLFAIGAAFVVLLAGLFAYTNLVPRDVVATIDGQTQKIITKEYRVSEFLDSMDVPYYEEDYLSTPPEGFIHDGMEFEMVHATDFRVTADGETIRYKSLKPTIGEALKDVGVKVREDDIVIPKSEKTLKQDAKIVVKRVDYKEKTVEEKVKFKTVKKDDTTMNEGETKVIKKGKNGKDKVTYRITYVDGKETKRKEIARETIEKKVNKVVAVGTRINYNGKNYSRKLVVKAYSYTGGGTTAMGTRARVGEIAVDPSVIPLGTNVYIEGVGPRRAEDTGGNIKGNTIDIYMNTQAECIRWGARYVTIYIE